MKRTIDNCSLIKKKVKAGAGEPNITDGKCEGYVVDDEPCATCKTCKLLYKWWEYPAVWSERRKV